MHRRKKKTILRALDVLLTTFCCTWHQSKTTTTGVCHVVIHTVVGIHIHTNEYFSISGAYNFCSNLAANSLNFELNTFDTFSTSKATKAQDIGVEVSLHTCDAHQADRPHASAYIPSVTAHGSEDAGLI